MIPHAVSHNAVMLLKFIMSTNPLSYIGYVVPVRFQEKMSNPNPVSITSALPVNTVTRVHDAGVDPVRVIIGGVFSVCVIFWKCVAK